MKTAMLFTKDKTIKKQDGFTLIELVIVIAILGILAGVGIMRFMDSKAAASKNTCYANRAMLARAFVYACAKGVCSEDQLSDFVKDPVKYDNGAYFAATPVCPEGGAYAVANGRITCDHVASNTEYNHDDPVIVSGDSGGIVDGSLANTIAAMNALGTANSTGGTAANNDLKNQLGGSFLQVDQSTIEAAFGNAERSDNNTLYWKTDQSGDSRIYFASTSTNSGDRTAYLVAVDGVLYKSSVEHTYTHLTTNSNVAGLYNYSGAALVKALQEKGFVAVGNISM
jgi:type IV pilus assembly protein PilA